MSPEFDADAYRSWFKAKFGEAIVERTEDPTIVLLKHSCQEAAEISAVTNAEQFGHPAHAEQREGRWVTVIDVAPSIARYREMARG